MFFKGSRYEKVRTHEITDTRGRKLTFKRIRFIPETPAMKEHMVLQGERLDVITYTHYRNAELFWRICDSNKAMFPDELVEDVGRRILIPSGSR